MRFQVPQFIDVEDKIFGQLTLKQAIYLGGGAGFVVFLFLQFGFFVMIMFGGPVALLAAALAFVKVNNRPFYLVVYAAVMYSIGNKLYLWKKVDKKVQTEASDATAVTPQQTSAISRSQLKQLAWSLDTRDSLYTDKHS